MIQYQLAVVINSVLFFNKYLDSYCLFSSFLSTQGQVEYKKLTIKRRGCTWDLNPGQQYNFYYKYVRKMIHLLSVSGIRTHYLLILIRIQFEQIFLRLSSSSSAPCRTSRSLHSNKKSTILSPPSRPSRRTSNLCPSIWRQREPQTSKRARDQHYKTLLS